MGSVRGVRWRRLAPPHLAAAEEGKGASAPVRVRHSHRCLVRQELRNCGRGRRRKPLFSVAASAAISVALGLCFADLTRTAGLRPFSSCLLCTRVLKLGRRARVWFLYGGHTLRLPAPHGLACVSRLLDLRFALLEAEAGGTGLAVHCLRRGRRLAVRLGRRAVSAGLSSLLSFQAAPTVVRGC